jgi:aspartyl-tRNA(Asn)/glutamyl-tRNA(Gln) amidotransferase subunit A
MARSSADPIRLDPSRFKLRAMAETRWGGDVSPHFETMMQRLENAIETLPDNAIDGGKPWPPAPLTKPAVPRFSHPPIRSGDDLTEASVGSIAQAVAAGVVTTTEVVEAFLERSARLDPILHVWAALDPEHVRTIARQHDEWFAKGGEAERLLAGVPIGVKDIFNTDAYSTAANSRVPPTFVMREDAIAVSWLTRQSALVLGKTATTEYAYADPSDARNPWNTAHTPGGSSSGSAAGVAARLFPAALGTQTAGSIIRPAAFCGVVGFKPTIERIARVDVVPLAVSLDHVGTLTRSVADAALLYRMMVNAVEETPWPETTFQLGLFPLRLAFWPDLLQSHIDESTRLALRDAVTKLERAGAEITLVTSELEFNHSKGFWENVLAAHTIIMAAEVAAYHLQSHPDAIHDLGPRLRAMVEVGALVPPQLLFQAQERHWAYWRHWHEFSEARNYDAVIVPAAPGTAPEGLDFTGDPSLNTPWTLLGVPAITIPIALADNDLPLGMQIVAPYGEDARLLAVADWCEKTIAFREKPNL